jgi:hypothetical protein
MTGEAQMINSGEEEIAIETLDPEARWVVKVGEANVSGLPEALITGNGYSIYSLKGNDSPVPRNNNFVSLSNPCANPANTGWSCGSNALISFEREIPAFGEIDLIIEVSEEASAGEVDLILGESSLTGTFPKGVYSITLNFSNTGPEAGLMIRSKNLSESDEGDESRFIRIVSINFEE